MSSSDSEDDIPIAKRFKTAPSSDNGNAPQKQEQVAGGADSSSEDDVPIAKRYQKVAPAALAATGPVKDSTKEAKKIPSGIRSNAKAQPRAHPGQAGFQRAKLNASVQERKTTPQVANGNLSTSESSSDSEDDVPFSQRFANKKSETPQKKKPARPGSPPRKRKSTGAREQTAKRRRSEGLKESDDKKIQWKTLRHNGLLFPPEYQPHGVKMLYDGVPVDLTPEQEEIASMYAIMLETDYMTKQKFLDNFWVDFRGVLGRSHVIKGLAKCNFRPIYDHLMAEREKKKALSREEKARLKEDKDKAEEKFKFAFVDDRREAVGNFRVEPPGLFRGRGEHPKMGKVKRRIYPQDVTINIGRGEATPSHPYPGQSWKEVRNDQSVTWLAFWKDPIQASQYKYVFMGANSVFKSESDQQKYEKARELKKHIAAIRSSYRSDWNSKDLRTRQMAVALYFIDILALRAGHEKDEEEADTVGCCTLKVENVECKSDGENHITFDFLGKDSIKYFNTVKVEPRVFQLVKDFCRGEGRKVKSPGDELFETMGAQDLNTRLKELMDGLSVKVFRTFNASITLDKELHRESTSNTVDEKKADYDLANREVAILCNHQRAVPKGHEDQMTRLNDKLITVREELAELELELKVVRGKADAKKLKDPDKKLGNEEGLKKKVEKKKLQLRRLQVQSKSKDDLKTVALGTSKINYLDPRITVAWCKRHEVPIEKIFNKTLLSKFHWAMEAEPSFRF